ncbi:MAG: tetratricopeptide repeat protein [Methanothrix sp.]|nr:tetratricopeptide repeat protein [Methanothrix sp.]
MINESASLSASFINGCRLRGNSSYLIFSICLLLASTSLLNSALGQTYSAEYWIQKGDDLNKAGSDLLAIACYDKAINANPMNATAWNNKGKVLYGGGLKSKDNYVKAISCFDKAIEIDPLFAGAWHGLGMAQLQLDMFKESHYSFDNATRLNPENSQYWTDTGKALIKLGQYQDSVNVSKKAIELMPQCSTAWNNVGIAQACLWNFSSSIRAHKMALSLEPENDQFRGDINDTKSLIRIYAESAEFWPKNLASISVWWDSEDACEYAKEALSKKSYNTSIGAYAYAILLNRNNQDAWWGLAVAYERANRWVDSDWAAMYLQNNIVWNPKDAKGYLFKGNVLAWDQKYKEAFNSYDKALEMDPLLSSAWTEKGKLFAKQNRKQEAEYCNRSAEALWPIGILIAFVSRADESNQSPIESLFGIMILIILIINFIKYILLKLSLNDRIKNRLKNRWISKPLQKIIRQIKKIRLRLFGKEQSYPNDIPEALANLTVIRNPILSSFQKRMPDLLIIMIFFGLIDLMTLFNLLIVMAAYFIVRSLIGYSLEALKDLYENVRISPKNNESYYSVQQAKSLLEFKMIRFIYNYDRMLNHSMQWIIGLVFSMAVWISTSLLIGLLRDVSVNTWFSNGIVGIHTIVQLLTGFAIGIMTWRIVVISIAVWRLGKQFDFNTQFGHPDGCGGFSPIGKLCLWNALAFSIPGVYLWGWIMVILYFFSHEIIPTSEDPQMRIIMYALLLFIPMALMITSFFLPQWNIHKAMVFDRTSLWLELSSKKKQIDDYYSAIMTDMDLGSEKTLDLIKRLEFLRQAYAEKQNMSQITWPFNMMTLAKFLTAVPLTVVPFVTLFKSIMEIF